MMLPLDSKSKNLTLYSSLYSLICLDIQARSQEAAPVGALTPSELTMTRSSRANQLAPSLSKSIGASCFIRSELAITGRTRPGGKRPKVPKIQSPAGDGIRVKSLPLLFVTMAHNEEPSDDCQIGS